MYNVIKSFLWKKGIFLVASFALTFFASQLNAATTDMGNQLERIKRMAERDRVSLVELARELEDEVENMEEEKDETPENIQKLQVEKNILNELAIENNLEKIQNAVTQTQKTAAAEFKDDATKEETSVKQKTGSAFDVEVTYTKDTNGEAQVSKVNLVAAEPSEVTDAGVKMVLDDEDVLEPVKKGALEAATAKLNEEIQEIDFVPEQKVEAAQEMKFQDKVADIEKEVKEDLDAEEDKREIASEDDEAELERKKAAQAFAVFAKDNPDSVKGMDKCEMAEKAMDLNPALEFDMLDSDTREDCDELRKKAEESTERKVLNIDDGDKAKAEISGLVNSDDSAQVQAANQRAQSAQQMLQVVMACYQMNQSAQDSVKNLEATIRPAYDAISGFDELEKLLQNTSTFQNVMAQMSLEGLDAETAAILKSSEFEAMYSRDETGDKLLQAELMKLSRLTGKLNYFVNEYKTRSEQIATAVAKSEADKVAELNNRAMSGDPSAQQEIAMMRSQNKPTNPRDVYDFHYNVQISMRQNSPKNQQQVRYLEAAMATQSALAQFKVQRDQRLVSSKNTFVSGAGSSNIVNQTRSAINSSSVLRRSAGNAASQALGGSLNNPTLNGGTLRSAGGVNVPSTRSPASNLNGTNRGSSRVPVRHNNR